MDFNADLLWKKLGEGGDRGMTLVDVSVLHPKHAVQDLSVFS